MRVLLVSTYELGHQPLHVASPAAALLHAGHSVRCLDLSVQPWSDEDFEWAEAVAFSVPMHTAMRLAVRAARRLKRSWPHLPVCLYGLYAAMDHDRTVGGLAEHVIAGEYESGLLNWLDDLSQGLAVGGVRIDLGKTAFRIPARHLLPPLDSYAHLQWGGEHRLVGYVEASHGCRHRCRHCPLPVVYDGRYRIVDEDVVLADVEQLAAAGARHITFGDPDFLNGPAQARRMVAAFNSAFPDLTFDVTAKVEHILRHEELWGDFARRGLLFVVSAFETTSNLILAHLDKGHTVAEAAKAVSMMRDYGVDIKPSWLPFTPWTSVGDLADIADFIVEHDLVESVDPIQLAIRLLVPEGSLLLDSAEMAPYLGAYDEAGLSYRWEAAQPRVDVLSDEAYDLAAAGASTTEMCRRAAAWAGRSLMASSIADPPRPRLTEPWFC